MNEQTIKVSLQSIEIPAISLYVHLISILLVFLLLKLVFGKQISHLVFLARGYLIDFFSRKSHDDWIAHCREREHWPQKQDALGLDLKGRYLKSLNFAITVMGNPQHWRAGFVLGNEKLKANQIVEPQNGITIHTGSDYNKREKLLPVWKFYEKYSQNNPDFSSVKFEDMAEGKFSISITNDKFMRVKVQNEVIFAQRIDSSFRRRVYLKAWVDTSPDCKIKFENIEYSLWS